MHRWPLSRWPWWSARRAIPARQESRDRRGYRVTLDRPVQPVHKVYQVTSLAHRGLLEPMARTAWMDRPDHRGSKAHRGCQDNRDRPEFLESRGHKVRPVPPGMMVHQG